MKKIIAMLLVLVMSVTGLVGCGSSKDNEAGSTSASSDSDWAYIQDKGKLTVGITLFAPMNYYNEKNKLVGFDTEMAEAVTKKLGIDVEFTEINWDSKEVELSSKNIDCIWNGFTINGREDDYTWSDPYLNNEQVMVVASEETMKKSREKEIMKSVKGLTVTAEQGSTGEGKIDGSIADDDTVKVSAQDYFKDANYVASDSMAKALMEVKSGTADVALVDSVCALGMVGEGTDYSDLVINMDNNFGQQEYGIAFRKGSDVTEKVNEAIKELYEDGTVDTIAKKYGLQEMLIK